jgi:hypothetical protein
VHPIAHAITSELGQLRRGKMLRFMIHPSSVNGVVP